jgi:hypothetical protein
MKNSDTSINLFLNFDKIVYDAKKFFEGKS